MIGLLLGLGLAGASSLQVLSKDHLVKDYLSLSLLTIIFRSYLADQTVDQLFGCLKKGGVKELLDFFPVNKRSPAELTIWFKKEGLPSVGDMYEKKRVGRVTNTIITGLKDLVEKDEDNETISSFLKDTIAETPIAEADFVAAIWAGLMGAIDWNTKPEQVDALAVKEVTKHAEVLEPFCNGPKTEVALINAVQLYCYEDGRVMKAFPQIIKVLYNKDCVSDQAIFYWHSKGSKPQGRQHFLTAMKPLVTFLRQQEEESEEEDE